MTPPATLASLSRHPLVPIPHDLSVSEALAVVRAHRVHHLPVIQGNALVGILCSCDLHSALPSASVTTIMRKAVIALDHDASVLDAVSTMNVHHVGSVVLMDAARACAIVTRADLLFAHPELAPLFVMGGRDCCGHAASSQPSSTIS